MVAARGLMTEAGQVGASDRVVIMLTGAGIKYAPPELPTPIDLTGSDEEIQTRVAATLIG
jgi:hypothetical protein